MVYRQKIVQMSFMKPERLPETSLPPLPTGAKNPLKEFPTKSKPIVSEFRAMDTDVKSTVKEIESRGQWLAPDKVDPRFGITGDTREVMIRRSFRRLESASLFKSASGETSLSEIVPSSGSPTRKFILVEESRVKELARLESILRDEQYRLGEQAVGVVSNYHVDARVPIPATRMAVKYLAEADQRGLYDEISKLHVAWHNYIVANNYDRIADVHNKASYVDRGPAALRALKLTKLVEANRDKVHKMEKDTMMFEDDLSYLNGAFAKAQERIWDYDRYYVLANRYGYMSEAEYYKDDRPGRRYYLRAVDGALKFQGIWGMYWAIQKMRYRKGATGFQKIIRGFLAWRKYHPLIIFRLKYGKRSYYEFCMHRWKKYCDMLRMCKVGIQWLLDREWIHKTFAAWKQFRVDSKEEKFRKAKQIFAKIMSAGVYKCFQALKGHALRQKYIKIKMRRVIGFPQFDMWCDYVDAVKHQKKINRAATKMASVARMFFRRREHKAKKKVGKTLGLLIRCRVILIRMRKKALGESFKLWEMLETEHLTQVQTAAERKRLQKTQERITEQERDELVRLRRHLKGGHGKMQIKRGSKALRASKSKELAAKYEEELYTRTSHVAKSIARHDLQIKDPPFLRCVDPRCTSTFVTYAQYHLHHLHNPRHQRQSHEHKAKLRRLAVAAIEEVERVAGHREEEGDRRRSMFNLRGTHIQQGQSSGGALQMMHLTPTAEEERKRCAAEEYEEEEVALIEANNKEIVDSTAASPAEILVISVSDFHLLLLQSQCRDLLIGSFTRLMNILKPVKLQRTEEQTNKKSLAQIMAEMGSDSGSDGEGDALISIDDALPQEEAFGRKEEEEEEEEEDNDDDNDDNDDDQLLAMQRAKEREDPITRNLKNATQLYAAIQEWRRQPVDSYQYKAHAIGILTKFLVDPEPSPLDAFEPTEELDDYEEKYDLSGYWSDESNESYDTVIREERAEIHRNRAAYVREQKRKHRMRLATVSKVDFSLCQYHDGAAKVGAWLPELVNRLQALKECTHKGFLKPMRMPRNCVRSMLGMQGRPYKIWTDEGVVPGDIFDRLELQCFQLLYQYVTHDYFNFHGSPEYIAYLAWTEMMDERRLFDMYVRAKDIRLKEFEKWSREVYYPKHMAIYRVSDQVVDRMVSQEASHIVDYALQLLVGEYAFLKNADLQEHYENMVMITMEAVDWTVDTLFNEWWDIYVDTAIKSMLEIDLVRGKLMEFVGMREKSKIVKKKLLVNVDMNASSGSLLDMLNDNVPVPIDRREDVSEDESKSGDDKKKSGKSGKGKKGKNKKNMTAGAGAASETKRGQEQAQEAVPGINVINVATSNHARWQAEKANKKSAAAARHGQKPVENDPHGQPPRHHPMVITTENHWDSLVTIQRLLRGVIGRNRARREFAETYVKKWDPTYGACYYANVKTEETSWEIPAIYKHLYPGKTW